MNSNIYFNERASVSPIRSNKLKTRNYDNASTNSYSDDILKQSISTINYTIKNSSDDLNVPKLESKILEMQKKIDEQRYQIQVLTKETQQYISVCDQQKLELNNMNIDMLKQEYHEQISQLIQEKDKITQMIYHLTQQYKSVQMQHQSQLQIIKARNMELARLIEEALNRKEVLLQEISISDKQHLVNEQTIIQQQERLDQLRNIERKLVIALKQIESLEKNE